MERLNMSEMNDNKTINKKHNSGCLIIFIIILFVVIILSLFGDDTSDEEWEQVIHQEKMDYIQKCASRAHYGIEDYYSCMAKRPDIR